MKCLSGKTCLRNVLVYIPCMVGLLLAAGCNKSDNPPVLKITTLATGLSNPIGAETDNKGRVWVAETGTGHNDGKVTVITSDGKKYAAIVNFESISTGEGDFEGPSHLLFDDGWLYILGAHGKMYKANMSSYKPGNTAISASTLTVENIGAFVLAYPFKNNTHETHPYNLVKGPDGAIYITDAAANAVLRRSRSGVLSVLAEVPGIPNPTPVGPPQIESVPTGIIYDRQNYFLVSTLLGFPFPPGKALIYKISLSGNVSVYQQGFTSLVDIAEGSYQGHLVVQHGVFGAMGFAPHTGKLVWANGMGMKTLTDGLNLPTGITQANAHTWYVTSLGDGSVLKVSY